MTDGTKNLAETVTLARPGGERDVPVLGPSGPVRFLEGRADGPLSVALELAGPGWVIEPRPELQTENERSEA